MEWIEITGDSVDEAKETALDRLGVDHEDAEFEVLSQAKLGLFGRVRNPARVRARVRPTAPRPKENRRDRKRKPQGKVPGPPESNGGESTDDSEPTPERTRASASSPNDDLDKEQVDVQAGPEDDGATRHRGRRAPRTDEPSREREPGGVEVDVPLSEQAEIGEGFLRGLVETMGLEAKIDHSFPDEETVEIQLGGDNLGILIGQKGTTLLAIQDLTRTVVQRKTGSHHTRLRVDIAQYRKRRSEALARFASKVAENVKASGTGTGLEPMSPADRKVVHDTLNAIDGVKTISQGEEPNRAVVVLPDNE